MHPNNGVKIFPSIAAGNLLNLESECKLLEAANADAIHFDVMDGHFVPLLTIGIPFLEAIRKITKVHLDVHIMVSNPEATFQQYIEAGADTLTFHAEAAIHTHSVLSKIKSRGIRAGIAINPGTHWSSLEFVLPFLDQVTLMTVNPGFSFQQHIVEVQDKLRALSQHRKEKNLNFEIQIDGGVTPKNAQILAEAGADILVAGGSVMRSGNYAEAISQLKSQQRG